MERAHGQQIGNQLVHQAWRGFSDLIDESFQILPAEQIRGMPPQCLTEMRDHDADGIHHRIAADLRALAIGFGNPLGRQPKCGVACVLPIQR